MTPWEEYKRKREEQEKKKQEKTSSSGGVQNGKKSSSKSGSDPVTPWQEYKARRKELGLPEVPSVKTVSHTDSRKQLPDLSSPGASAPVDMKSDPYGRKSGGSKTESVRSKEGRTQWEVYKEALDREKQGYLSNAGDYQGAAEELLSYDRNALRTDSREKGPKLSQQKPSASQLRAEEQYLEEAVKVSPYAKKLAEAQNRFYEYDHSFYGYRDKIDTALEKGNWQEAGEHLEQMTRESLSPEERDLAVSYINTITDKGYLERIASTAEEARDGSVSPEARSAKEHLQDLADRGNWEELYDLMNSGEGAEYKRLLKEEYGIDADSPQSREGNYMGLISQLEYGEEYGYHALSGSAEKYKTMLGTTAFTQRATEEVQRAGEHEGTSAQMDSFVRAQTACYVLDQLYYELGLGTDSLQTSDTLRSRYLLKFLKEECGVDLTGINGIKGSDGAEMIRKAQEDQGKKADLMHRTLKSQGYDTEVVRKYMENTVQQGLEEEEEKAFEEFWSNANFWEKFGMNALTVPHKVFASPLWAATNLGQLGGKGADPDDPNSYVPALAQTDGANKIRQATAEDMGSGLLSFLYNAGTSAADSAASAFAFGPGATVTLALTSAGDTASDILARGGSRQQALRGGLAAGIIEALTEYFSIDQLLKGADSVQGLKSLIKSTGKQAFVEGTEEMSSEILNIIVDSANMGNLSHNSQAVAKYMEEGMGYNEARSRVLADNVRQVAESGLAGAVSGGMSAGAFGLAPAIRGHVAQMPIKKVQKALDILGNKADTADAYTLGRALHTVGIQLSQEALGIMEADLQSRGKTAEEASRIAGAVEKAVKGERLTSQEKKLLQGDPAAGEMLRAQLKTEESYAESTAVNDDPATHTQEEMQRIEEYKNAVDPGLLEFIKESRNGGKDNDLYHLEPATERAQSDIKNITGIDVSGYKTAIERRQIWHILKRHGEKGRANQTMSNDNNIARVQYILNHYDSAVDGGKSEAYTTVKANGKQANAKVVVFSKKIDGTYYVAEAVPNAKRKTLFVTSAYIDNSKQKETGTPQLVNAQNSPVETSETSSASVPVGFSVPQDGGTVNRNYDTAGEMPRDPDWEQYEAEHAGERFTRERAGDGTDQVEQMETWRYNLYHDAKNFSEEELQRQIEVYRSRRDDVTQADKAREIAQYHLDALELVQAERQKKTAAMEQQTGGKDYETETGNAGLRNGNQRNDSMDPQGQVGTVGEGRSLSSFNSEGTGNIPENRGKDLRRQRLTNNERSFRDVTHYVEADRYIADADIDCMIAVIPEEYYTEEMSLKAADIERRGTKVRYFKGTLLIVGNDGLSRRANGCYDPNTDTIWASVAYGQFAPEQIAAHEEFHAMVEKGAVSVEKITKRIRDIYTEEEFQAVVEQYLQCYRGVYNELHEDDIVEEILADTYAGMNRFPEYNIEKYSSAIRDSLTDPTQRAAQNRRAMERKTAPPGRKYSVEEVVVGEEGIYENCVVLDTDLFNHINPRNWGKVLGEFVYQNLAGQQLTMYDEYGHPETVEVARANDRVRKDGAKNSHKVLDKLARYRGDNVRALATVHLSEMLQASGRESRSKENNHQWLDQNGWLYRRVYIVNRDGVIYDATLNIADGRERRIIYDINNIRAIDKRKETAHGVVPSTENGRGSHIKGSSSADRISDDAKNVKQNFSVDNEGVEGQKPRTTERKTASPSLKFSVETRTNDKTQWEARHEWAVYAAVADALDHADGRHDNLIEVGEMPPHIKEISGVDGKFYVYRDHLYENIVSKKKSIEDRRESERHFHDLGEERVAKAILSLNKPLFTVAEVGKEGNPELSMVLPVNDDNGDPLYAVFSLYKNKPINGAHTKLPHIVLTISPRVFRQGNVNPAVDRKPSTEEVIKEAIKKGTLLDVDIKNRDDYAVTAQHYSLGSVSQTSLKENIARFKEKVNSFRQKNKIRYSLEADVAEFDSQYRRAIAKEEDNSSSPFQEDGTDKREREIVRDEVEYQARRKGYPIIEGVQIVPNRTWVRVEEVDDKGNAVRENYGLVIGNGHRNANNEQLLEVSFWNKHRKNKDGSDVRGVAYIKTKYLHPVQGSFQMTNEEYESLMGSEPETVQYEDRDYETEYGEELEKLYQSELDRETAEEEYRRNYLMDSLVKESETKEKIEEDREVTITRILPGGETADFTYGRGRPFYSQSTTLSSREAVAYLQNATGMVWRSEPMRKGRWKAVMTDERLEKVLLPPGYVEYAKELDEENAKAEAVGAPKRPMPTAKEYSIQKLSEGIRDPNTPSAFDVHSDGIKKKDFKASPALEKIGVKIDGSITDYTMTAQILEREQSRYATEKQIDRAKKNYAPSEKEKKIASDIARGDISYFDVPSDCRFYVVSELAGLYIDMRMIGEDLSSLRKNGIRDSLLEKCMDLFPTEKHLQEHPEDFKSSALRTMNYRTAQRNMLHIFGEEKGTELNNYFFDPVARNEAERIRWIQRQLDAVREFEGSDGKKKTLTAAESAYVHELMDLEGYVKKVNESKNKEEIIKGAEDLSKVEKATDEDIYQVSEKYGLNRLETEWMTKYAQWLALEAGKSTAIDTKRCEAAAETFRQLFDDYFYALNDFLVAHGETTIGRIEGYTPHLTANDKVNLLSSALENLGFNPNATTLPAEIAGRTEQFRPNKRWTPFFQHRSSHDTNDLQYDIIEGFESYVTYISDVLFHMDDIQKIRAAESYVRTGLRGSFDVELQEAIDYSRSSDREEKIAYLVDRKKIGTDDEPSDKEIAKIFSQLIEEAVANLEKNTRYSDMAVWLQNYGNILAGKQFGGDRGIEQRGGRSALSIGNKINSIFARSNVAANISSALNQTAQVTMLFAERKVSSVKTALGELATGKLREFAMESDFLTGKRGVNYIITNPGEMVMSKLYAPAEFMDSMISTLAVRSAYLDAIKKGMNHERAMRFADNYGRNLMGDRTKGSKPLAFHSKGFIMQMLNMFQIEALNVWEHITQDLPADFRQIAREEGKAKAARALAVVLLKYLIAAFVWNRLSEELYGGTPAPLDLLGMTANFVASGKGVSTNSWIRNILKKGVGVPIFEETRENEEFDWNTAVVETAKNISNEIPFLSNASGILGIGDKTIPSALPGVSQSIKKIVNAITEDGVVSEALGLALIDGAKNLLPGGRQLSKTAGGIRALVDGGKMTGAGDEERLQFTTEATILEVLQQILFGVNGTTEARDYYASGESGLSVRQTDLWKDIRQQGGDGEALYDLLILCRWISDDEELTSAQRKEQQRNAINESSFTDDQKAQIYSVVFGDKDGTAQDVPFGLLMDAGLSWDGITEMFNEYKRIGEQEELDAKGQTTAFLDWVIRQGYSPEQKQIITDNFRYGTYMFVDPSKTTYGRLIDQGISPENARAIAERTEDTEENEKGTANTVEAIMKQNMNDNDTYGALATVLNESTYDKLTEARSAGISCEVYIAFWKGKSEIVADKDEEGKSISGSAKKKTVDLIDSLPLSQRQKDVLFLFYYAETGLKDTPWHN